MFWLLILAYSTLYAGFKTDTLHTSGGAYLTRMSTPSAGITRANIDTSKTRHAVADTGTFGIIKGAKTIRDTTTFTGGAYFAGIARFAGTLYAPTADIDTVLGGTVWNLVNERKLQIRYDSVITIRSRNNSGSAERLRYEAENHRFNGNAIFENGVKVVGACTTSTLNTGNGDNELYPMNQDVRTTASPEFAGITIAGGSQLTNFSKGTFVCSLYVNNNTDFVGRGTVQYQVVDSLVTLRFPYISGTITTAGVSGVNVRNVPTALRSGKSQQTNPVSMYENGGYNIGLFTATNISLYFYFTTSASGSPATGTFTVDRCVVQYFL